MTQFSVLKSVVRPGGVRSGGVRSGGVLANVLANVLPNVVGATARSRRLAILFSLTAGAIHMTAQAADPQAPSRSIRAMPETRTDTPSGLPVPRFVSLKADETFCRTGPTFSHPVRITYRRRGLPTMVVAETRDHWRKIRDAEGDECWIHRTKLSGAQTVMVLEDGLVLRARPFDGAMQKARLGRGLIARVEKSADGWVKISAPNARGWAPQKGFWGVIGDRPQRP